MVKMTNRRIVQVCIVWMKSERFNIVVGSISSVFNAADRFVIQVDVSCWRSFETFFRLCRHATRSLQRSTTSSTRTQSAYRIHQHQCRFSCRDKIFQQGFILYSSFSEVFELLFYVYSAYNAVTWKRFSTVITKNPIALHFTCINNV